MRTTPILGAKIAPTPYKPRNSLKIKQLQILYVRFLFITLHPLILYDGTTK